jgi:uncharacterized oligopeptide transporter (OPT) family protein
MLGGVVHFLIDREVDNRYDATHPHFMEAKERESQLETIKEKIHNRGVLFSSGLIAGEALMGIVLAVLVVQGISLAVISEPVVILGVGFFLFLAFMLWRFGNQSIDEYQFK